MSANTRSGDADDRRDLKTEPCTDDAFLANLKVKLDKMSQELDVATVRLEKQIEERKLVLKRKRTLLETANELTQAVQDRLDNFKRLKEKAEDQRDRATCLGTERDEADEEVWRMEKDFQNDGDVLAKVDCTFKPFLINKNPK